MYVLLRLATIAYRLQEPIHKRYQHHLSAFIPLLNFGNPCQVIIVHYPTRVIFVTR